MDFAMSEELWEPIDKDIFEHRVLHALIQIRKTMGCGLKEAIDIVHQRYEELRRTFPERFTVGADEYWIGFES
jgi:hypothetical protein